MNNASEGEIFNLEIFDKRLLNPIIVCIFKLSNSYFHAFLLL